MVLGRAELAGFPGQDLSFGAHTDQGRHRERNEDSCGVRARGFTDEALPIDAVFIAADGVGGHDGGAVASRFVVDAVGDTLAAQGRVERLDRWMGSLLDSIHAELLREAAARGLPGAMGSTATVAAIDGTDLVIAHVGDSRAYRLRNGHLVQLTEDDSWVAAQVRAGVDDDIDYGQKNVLTQCIGIGASLKVHVESDRLSPGDRYLLCSDGLHGVVNDQRIQQVLESAVEPAEAARTLVELANEAGGPDNITAVVFDIGQVPVRPAEHRRGAVANLPHDIPAVAATPTATRREAALPLGSLLVAAGLVLLVSGGLAGTWAATRGEPRAVDALASPPATSATSTERSATPLLEEPSVGPSRPDLPASLSAATGGDSTETGPAASPDSVQSGAFAPYTDSTVAPNDPIGRSTDSTSTRPTPNHPGPDTVRGATRGVAPWRI